MDSCKGQRAVSLDTELDAGEVFFCSKGYGDGLFAGNNLCFSQNASGGIVLVQIEGIVNFYRISGGRRADKENHLIGALP